MKILLVLSKYFANIKIQWNNNSVVYTIIYILSAMILSVIIIHNICNNIRI